MSPVVKMSNNECTPYLPLYKAALEGNWEKGKKIIEADQAALTARITHKKETALHIAVGTGHSNKFVEKLVDLMPEDLLEATDTVGSTALILAAIVGNKRAVEILVNKKPVLLQIKNKFNHVPLHVAAQHGHKELVDYLLPRTEEVAPSTFAGEDGVHLLNLLIWADFYGIALKILRKYPSLAIERDHKGKTALQLLSEKPRAFESCRQMGCLSRLIQPYILVEENITAPSKEDMRSHPRNVFRNNDEENPSGTVSPGGDVDFFTKCLESFLKKLRQFGIGPPQHIYDTNLMHREALNLVREICQATVELNRFIDPADLLKPPMFTAAALGIPEIVTQVVKTYPYAIWLTDDNGNNVIRLAVLHRQEKVYNLLYQMSIQRQVATHSVDNRDKNTILHFAGKLKPSERICGAALQMQRELQWFKEVEKLLLPSWKEKKNIDGKTPRAMFTEEHKELVKKGEKWMKGTASSCTVVAALVATVVFAAAFTVPGGNKQDMGTPIFLKDQSFQVFIVSDALALSCSVTSVLMFLGILTSRYAEEDFLKSLPLRLSVGLIALFISITCMVIAFSASLYIVVDHHPKFLIPIMMLVIVPATSFAWLQFPLLVEIIGSTFGRSIFGQQSKEIIY